MSNFYRMRKIFCCFGLLLILSSCADTSNPPSETSDVVSSDGQPLTSAPAPADSPPRPAVTFAPIVPIAQPVMESSSAPQPVREEYIPHKSVAQAFEDLVLRDRPDIRLVSGSDISRYPNAPISVYGPEINTRWVFLPRSHPAYPAVARWSLASEGESFVDVLCEGQLNACKEFTKAQKEQAKNPPKKRPLPNVPTS